MISHNKILGSLIYKTRKSINQNAEILQKASEYYFSNLVMPLNELNLWHYPGTHNEISKALLLLAQNGSELKYPSVLSFQPVTQYRYGRDIEISYNLAIVSPVKSEWFTEQREKEVFEKVLRPIYKEFMKQIEQSNYFRLVNDYPPHNYYEVYTTGSSGGVLIDKYGDHIDAIELHNLKLVVNSNLCERYMNEIEQENKMVTENFELILNKKNKK